MCVVETLCGMQSEANVALSCALSRDHAVQDPRQVERPRGERVEATSVLICIYIYIYIYIYI